MRPQVGTSKAKADPGPGYPGTRGTGYALPLSHGEGQLATGKLPKWSRANVTCFTKTIVQGQKTSFRARRREGVKTESGNASPRCATPLLVLELLLSVRIVEYR
eukprot:2871538-Rhodomonas_salina.1